MLHFKRPPQYFGLIFGFDTLYIYVWISVFDLEGGPSVYWADFCVFDTLYIYVWISVLDTYIYGVV